MNKETIFSILNTLMQRHDEAGQKYREAAAMTTDKDMVDFLESLAGYRKELWEEVRTLIEDMPPSPVTVSTDTHSYLNEHWGKMREALLLNNRSNIASVCNDTETNLSEYYKKSLEKEDIPGQIKSILEQQHKRVVEVTRKTDRMEKVPSGK